MKDRFDPNNTKKFADSLDNALDTKLVSTEQYEQVKVELKADRKIEIPLFKPHPLMPSIYLAHPQTIRAVREDLFMIGQGFEDLELLYRCHDCKNVIDMQFWKHCPYCETQFPKDLLDKRNKLHPVTRKDLTRS